MNRPIAVMSIASLLLAACASGPTAGARDVRFRVAGKKQGTAVSEAELQQDLQRFSGQFIDQMTQAAASSFPATETALREAALRRLLVYDSSVIDIATGSLPEINLLDMVVFITLSRS